MIEYLQQLSITGVGGGGGEESKGDRRVSLVDEWKGGGGGGGQFRQGKDCSCVKHGSKKAL